MVVLFHDPVLLGLVVPGICAELPAGIGAYLQLEYLPGQYDQRGDSAEQCVQLLTQGERCKVLTARVIALKGNITDEELVKVEEYLINPVESRLASLEKPKKTLDMEIPVPENVPCK